MAKTAVKVDLTDAKGPFCWCSARDSCSICGRGSNIEFMLLSESQWAWPTYTDKCLSTT